MWVIILIMGSIINLFQSVFLSQRRMDEDISMDKQRSIWKSRISILHCKIYLFFWNSFFFFEIFFVHKNFQENYFFQACARSLPAVKYTLRKHEQKIKHIRRAEEHSKMVQKSKFLKMKNSSNQFIQRPYKTRLLPSLPSSISVTQYKAKNSSDIFLKSQQNFREIVNFTKKIEVKPKTKLFSCLSCQTKFGSILNLIQHVVCNVFGV